jgi:putative FmdB family regulatory protein
MPTYEYECAACGLRFEQRQAMTEAPLRACPECAGELRRLITGGAGFVMKDGDSGRSGSVGRGCSLEEHGKTCCGRDQRCGEPQCGK